MITTEQQDKILELIYDNLLGNKTTTDQDHFLFVGRNSVGKSYLFSRFYKKYIEGKYSERLYYPIYFIDTVNRTLPGKARDSENMEKDYYNNVVNTRFKEENFNIQDSFHIDSNGNRIKGELVKWYEQPQKFKENIEKLTACLGFNSFKIIKTGIDEKDSEPSDSTESLLKALGYDKAETITEYEYIVDGKTESTLSSGLQAMLRISVELIYAKKCDAEVIFIDEVALHLNPETARAFVTRLSKVFPKFKWVWTTHSADVLLACQNFNIIEIDVDKANVFNGNDFMITADLSNTFEFLCGAPVDTGEKLFNKFLKACRENDFKDGLIKDVKNCKVFTTRKRSFIDSVLEERKLI